MGGQVAAQQHAIARLNATGTDLRLRVQPADAGGVDEKLIALAALDHLGVAGYDLHTRFLRSEADRHQYLPEIGHSQAFLQNETQGQVLRYGPAHSQVIDGAVNGQFADVAAGKKDRRHDKAVGRKGHGTAKVEHGPVVPLVEPVVRQQFEHPAVE